MKFDTLHMLQNNLLEMASRSGIDKIRLAMIDVLKLCDVKGGNYHTRHSSFLQFEIFLNNKLKNKYLSEVLRASQ